MSQQPYNRTLGVLRIAATFTLILLLAWFSRPTPLTVSLGFLFVAAGEAVRFWAAGHLLKSVELVTSGPYRYTRNPLYLGRLLILTGVCVMAHFPLAVPGLDGFTVPLNLLVLLLGYVIFFGYYLRRKERVEPARLLEIHGEPFQRYFEAVPALFPTLRPYRGASGSGWSSDRMVRNREHWMVIGLAALTLFMLWRAYQLRV